MIDIHMHLVPGVDDGADSMDNALIMLLTAMDQGIHSIIATPHSEAFDRDPVFVQDQYDQLCRRAPKSLKIYPGCEVYCDSGSMEDVVRKLASKQYPTLNGTNYVLMEFSLWVLPEDARSCITALIDAGYAPVIAHMERYVNLRNDTELVDWFRQKGALIQVNVYDLFDEMDEKIKGWARTLVLSQRVDLLGTDAHMSISVHRPPSVTLGMGWLRQHCPGDYVDAISIKNAERMLLSGCDR